MRKPKKYEVQVEGRGQFPIDMLRYDRGIYKTDTDARVAADTRAGRRYVWLICEEPPTTARWESFLWAVVETKELV